MLQLCRRQIALPRLQVHTVRIEAYSCDRVALCIVDPA
jgi:hypothetical protein